METSGSYSPKTSYSRVADDLIAKETVTDTIHFDTYGRGTLTASGNVALSVTGLKANKTYALLLLNSGAHTITFADTFVYPIDGITDFTAAGDYLLTLYCYEDTIGSKRIVLAAVLLGTPVATTTTTTAASTTTTTA